jgi:hypothetical protein
MTLETTAIAISAVASCMSLAAMYLGRRAATPSRPDHTITITIEDSTGACARTVARSDRSVDELKRLLDRFVAQPS